MERKVGTLYTELMTSRKMYATTHVCNCTHRVAYINHIAETQRDSFTKHLCMQLAEDSRLHFLNPCRSGGWINAMCALLRSVATSLVAHIRPSQGRLRTFLVTL